MANRWTGVALLVVGIATAAFFLLRDDDRQVVGDGAEPRTALASPDRRPLAAPENVRPAPIKKKRKVTKAEREAFREQIQRGLKRRAAAPSPRDDADEGDDADDADHEPSGEGVKDRTGGDLSSLVATVNEDFLPLANECYAMALERSPGLRGMLDMNITLIADEEVGGLVESADLGEENEIDDAEMTECIRESMFATVFPAPPASGQAEMRLTLRFEDTD